MKKMQQHSNNGIERELWACDVVDDNDASTLVLGKFNIKDLSKATKDQASKYVKQSQHNFFTRNIVDASKRVIEK